MFLDLRTLFITFLISFLFSLFTIPWINKIGKKFNIYDIPSRRKLHNEPKVRIGGISIYISFLFGLIFSYLIFNDSYSVIKYNMRSIIILIISTFSYFSLGLLDDIYKISFKLRLIIQFIIAFLIWLNNIYIDNIGISFFNLDFNLGFNNFISLIFTLFWIVGVINAINWLDGLDGLSSGFIAIICIPFIVLSLHFGNYYLIPLILSLLGSCLGFLRYNSYPSKILMGDGGSNFLGAFIALISILSIKTSSDALQLIPSAFLISIPILDMAFVIITRFMNKRSPFLPDNNHLHHRIMNLGFSHRKTVYSIYILTVILSSIICILYY